MDPWKEKEMREKLGEINSQLEGILSRAENENRDLTDEEQQRFDDLKERYKAQKRKVENYEFAKKATEYGEAPLNSNLRTVTGSGVEQPDKNDEPEGRSFQTKSGENIRIFGKDENMTKGSPDVNVGQMARAMLTGTRNEAEKRALAEGTDSAGGFTVPHATLTQFYDELRAKSRVVQAGAQSIQLSTDKTTAARVASSPTVTWHQENATETAQDVTFEGVSWDAKTMYVLVRGSREMIADSVNINQVMQSVFSGTIATALDNGILFGAGSNEIKGLTSYSIPEVAHDAALTNYDPLVSAYRKMLDQNANGPSAYIMAPREWETLATLKDSNSRYLDRPQALDGIPFYDTTNVPTDGGAGSDEGSIITGDFSNLIIGLRSEMRIELLRERFADSYQFGFLCHMRVDAVPVQDGSFAKVTGIIPAA